MLEGQSTKADYRTALNAFRGFAALYVVFYHVRYYSDYDWTTAVPIIQYGYLGVDFFFVLSGLIISHTYLERSRNPNSNFWFKFIWYRLARLFPVHLLIMVSMLIGAMLKPVSLSGQDMFDWLGLTFMVRQWYLPETYVWNSPAWSISAELFAYVFVFPIIVRIAPRVKTKMDAIKLMGIGAAFLLMLVQVSGTVNETNYAGPIIRVIGGFTLGCGLFLLLSCYQPSEAWDKRLRCSLLCTPIAFWIAIKLHEIGGPTDLLLIMGFTFLISCLYLAKGRLASILSIRQFFWFGEISFALYLCHIPVMRVYAFVAEQFGLSNGLYSGLFTIAVSIGVAHLLYRYVEMPSRHFMRRWYKHRSVQGKLRFG